METCRIFILHLVIFAATGVAVLTTRLAAGYMREIRLILELRRMHRPSPTKPVFVDVQSVLLRMGQAAVDIFKREVSVDSIRNKF